MMQGLTFLLGLLSVLVPFVIFLYVVFTYQLAIGNLSIKGVARRIMDERKHWTNVLTLSENIGRFIALVYGSLGALIAFFGFLLPWIATSLQTSLTELNVSVLEGPITGIGMFYKSMRFGFGLFGTNEDGAVILGLAFLLLAILFFILSIVILLTGILGIRLVSLPFSAQEKEVGALPQRLMIVSGVALSLALILLMTIQVFSNGIEISSSQELFGFRLSMFLSLVKGFWISVWGLMFSLLGTVSYKNLIKKYAAWLGSVITIEG